MVTLCTLPQAKAQIGIDHDLDDVMIEEMIEDASDAIINYLKQDADRYLTSSGGLATDSSLVDPPNYGPVRRAVIILTEIYYNDRNGGPATVWPQGYLPTRVTSHLWQLRKPALG
jgi:hypothetical protein